MSYYVWHEDISPYNFIIHTNSISKMFLKDWKEISNSEYLVLAKKFKVKVYYISDGKMTQEKPL